MQVHAAHSGTNSQVKWVPVTRCPASPVVTAMKPGIGRLLRCVT
jgi:hypothetical protein